jgi:hypothetical protein
LDEKKLLMAIVEPLHLNKNRVVFLEQFDLLFTDNRRSQVRITVPVDNLLEKLSLFPYESNISENPLYIICRHFETLY